LEKYAKNGEDSPDKIFSRVSLAIAKTEEDAALWAPLFHKSMNDGFIPAGRIMSAAGTDIQATLINCFVQPVGDSVSERVDGKPSIFVAVNEAAETMRRGGGVGYDFSLIRPNGAKVKGTSSRASGPVSYMEVFNSTCNTVESAGARRGAQMGVLRCDHPDIMEFIAVKHTKGVLEAFNLSIGVADDLIKAAENNESYQLIHKAEPSNAKITDGAFQREDGMWVYETVVASELWDAITKSTYEYSEPGVLFIDRMNAENNLYYCEVIEATNPCAEQPLPDYGCCCLGSINLTKMVDNPFTAKASFNNERFAEVVKMAGRMLDNVLDMTYWPLEQQRQQAMDKRRIGIGYTGLGDALIMLGLRYDTDDAINMAKNITEAMRNAAYAGSVELAKEKGSFQQYHH